MCAGRVTMDKQTLNKANEIKQRIEELQKEIEEFPRYIVDPKEYKKSGHMYVKRLLIRERYKLKVPKGYFQKDLEFELSEEDLQALVELRQKKIAELEEELKSL